MAVFEKRLFSIGPLVKKKQSSVRLPIFHFMGRTIKVNCLMVLLYHINSASHGGYSEMSLSVLFISCLVVKATVSAKRKE